MEFNEIKLGQKVKILKDGKLLEGIIVAKGKQLVMVQCERKQSWASPKRLSLITHPEIQKNLTSPSPQVPTVATPDRSQTGAENAVGVKK
ncbi:hypothetical protein HYR54_03630 [Candidatus Acetothermia bacterium]|nr:hypothetical protein [Candidatus Acetothermia bacterium]